MDSDNVVELRGITKRFGTVTANENVDLVIKNRQIQTASEKHSAATRAFVLFFEISRSRVKAPWTAL